MTGPAAEELGRQLLPPGSPLLRELVRKRPGRVVLDIVVSYVVIVLAFMLLAWAPAWWSAVIAFLVVGNRQYALSVLTHDGDHRTLFRQLRANDLFTEVTLCAAVGVDFHGERANHARHHLLLAREDDPDRYLYSVEDKSTRGRFLLFLTGLTMFPRALAKALRGGPRPSGTRVAFLARRGYTIVAQIAIFMAISAYFPPWYYLVFWVAPIYPLVFVPHKIRMFCEHAQPVAPDRAVDDRRLVTFVPGRIERMLFSPYNLNFHAEHHLWPYVPYYNVARLHAIISGRTDIEVRKSYVGFLFEYFSRLPLTHEAARHAA